MPSSGLFKIHQLVKREFVHEIDMTWLRENDEDELTNPVVDF